MSSSSQVAATTGARPRILVHICCGPCSIMPLKKMLGERAEVWGFFHNPNIHPLDEFRKRLAAVKALAGYLELDVIYDEAYSPKSFVKGVRSHTGVRQGRQPSAVSTALPPRSFTVISRTTSP